MAKPKEPTFSRVWETVLYAMGHSGVTKTEALALVALLRYQDEANRLSRPVADIAREIGVREDQVRRALSNLTRKEFRAPDGSCAVFLTRTRQAHRGQVAEYRLNVPRAWGDSRKA